MPDVGSSTLSPGSAKRLARRRSDKRIDHDVEAPLAHTPEPPDKVTDIPADRDAKSFREERAAIRFLFALPREFPPAGIEADFPPSDSAKDRGIAHTVRRSP